MFYVRTAESGGVGICCLKEISGYFSIAVDALLSGDQLILIAKIKTNPISALGRVCDLVFGFADLLCLMLVFLPL